jgi:hypothetical protein
LEFEWDPQKAAANLAKHRVSLEEAATVFGDPLGGIVADPRHSSGDARFVLLGLSLTAVCIRSCMLSGTERFASSARDRQPAVNEGTMKKSLNKAEVVNQVDADEILPEYDFSGASPNKYASRYTRKRRSGPGARCSCRVSKFGRSERGIASLSGDHPEASLAPPGVAPPFVEGGRPVRQQPNDDFR